MSCPQPEFQADFFNNIAAVAMVLIFAKVFAHRSRNTKPQNGQPTPGRANFRACCHGLAIAAAVVAVGAALWATEDGRDKCSFHWFAWGGLIVAGVVFVGEIFIDDVWPHLKKPQQTLSQRNSG